MVSEALSDRAHRLLSIGVQRMENRHYGTPEQHDEAHSLDIANLRRRIGEFLEAEPARVVWRAVWDSNPRHED